MQPTLAQHPAKQAPPQTSAAFRFPTIPNDHWHVRALLENAMRYIAPQSGTIDLASGYPVEGWNNDAKKGLALRSFTQLTAIGEWIEVLANVVAGYADTPYLSRDEALARLTQVVHSLRHDQKDPEVSAKGLLGNFLDLAAGCRQGPLANDVDKRAFLTAFGPEKGEAVWRALAAKGWIVPASNGVQAAIQRSPTYGSAFFNGPLAPYADKATKTKIMGILDRRVVLVVFGDNANLSTSVAKAIGALLLPRGPGAAAIVELTQEMERFLQNQQQGYARLYDAKAGLFYFGWDATKDRLLGWEDGQGHWQAGHMDYLVNEFRGPTTFVVVRYGLPVEAIRNLGFQIKPYRLADGREVFTLAPWEGSAFQALGLGLPMIDLANPSWREILQNVVDIEIDYATRKGLPGFLSESYVGEGPRYTGDVGIPDIAVDSEPRITHIASLYTLGVAYGIAPAKIERFLAVHWPTISTLLTSHGPWEGFNVAKHEPIRVQTTAHTLSLILGLLGTGSEDMKRYLACNGLDHRLAEIYRSGQAVDLLSDHVKVFAWSSTKNDVQSARTKDAFHVKSDCAGELGIAFVPARPEGMNLSSGLLRLCYRSSRPIHGVILQFKPKGNGSGDPPWIPKELFLRLADTHGRQEELQIPLPATPGLNGIKELVISHRQKQGRPLDLSITHLAFAPLTGE